ncbi:MAG TPA: hypothetical protein PLX59_04580 [Candidatus Cloacimonadota bacterium]|nr:hypothetical protein [Candidatus Cloacimonadota bacterium]
MAIPIINDWQKYFHHPDEGLGSSYERIILNGLLADVISEHGIKSILETPSFGFTGLSGINLVQAALDGVSITLEDDDAHRLEQIRALWQDLNLPLKSKLNPGFRHLDYPGKSFDMAFNFSALWFVENLRGFLEELARVSSKLIFISVPNRSGIGYKGQLKGYSKEAYPQLKPEYIDPASVIHILKAKGWKLLRKGFFDCPLWPDIGMSKEDFLMQYCMICKVLGKCKVPIRKTDKAPVCIMDYYKGNDADFPNRMLRYNALERFAPNAFKRYWAHHYYLIFCPGDNA